MNEPNPCPHTRRRLVAKDQESEYVECLDCGAILEREELGETSGFNESLSDA
jgi:transcription initiation factor TFIIIB Brf1 subunit/transcription initiation factor TFIIB